MGWRGKLEETRTEDRSYVNQSEITRLITSRIGRCLQKNSEKEIKTKDKRIIKECRCNSRFLLSLYRQYEIIFGCYVFLTDECYSFSCQARSIKAAWQNPTSVSSPKLSRHVYLLHLVMIQMRKSSKTILIIDDDKDFQTILQAIFLKSGYMVRSLFNGKIAESLRMLPHPDIILLDIDLPDLNGVEVGKQLKSNAETKDIPVIMVSANPYLDQLCKEAGAVDFVQKPFTLNTLIQKVRDRLAA